MLVFGEVIPKAVARERATGLILRLFPVLETAGPASWPRSPGGPTPSWDGRSPLVGTRSAPEHPPVRLARGAQAPAPDGAGGGRRHGHRGRDDRQDLRPRGDRGARGHGARWSTWPRSPRPPRPPTRSASSRSAASRASRSSPTACSTSWAWSPPWTSAARGRAPRTSRALMRPATYVPETKRIDDLLREMQKNRAAAGGGGGRVRRRGRHRHGRGHRRGDRGRDPRRARPHPRHGGAPARRQLPGGGPGEPARRSTTRSTGTCPRATSRRWPASSSPPLHRIPLVGEVFRVGRYTFTVLEADKRRVLTVRITPDPTKTAQTVPTSPSR